MVTEIETDWGLRSKTFPEFLIHDIETFAKLLKERIMLSILSDDNAILKLVQQYMLELTKFFHNPSLDVIKNLTSKAENIQPPSVTFPLTWTERIRRNSITRYFMISVACILVGVTIYFLVRYAGASVDAAVTSSITLATGVFVAVVFKKR